MMKNTNRKSSDTIKLLGILFILSSSLCKAQATVEWSEEPGGVALAKDQSHDIYSANWDINPNGATALTKINSLGNIVWTASYDHTVLW